MSGPILSKEHDKRWMKFAIALSEKSQGLSSENPNVGCVVVDSDGNLCGSGFTQPGGRPHAEIEALKDAGKKAKGGILYVTLEPCSHYGQTPPCVKAIIHAGIKRVVIAIIDPDKRVNGSGINQLKQAGLEVEVGLMRGEAIKYIPSFLARNSFLLDDKTSNKKKRPYITVKVAHSLDGFVSKGIGLGGKISNQVSDTFTHDLRSRVDAILISYQTAQIDNPRLNARIDGLEHPTERIILDKNLALDKLSNLVKTSDIHPLTIVTKDKPKDKHWIHDKIVNNQIRLLIMEKNYNLEAIFNALLEQGFGHILVEPGPRLLKSLFSEKLVNEFFEVISKKKLIKGYSIGVSAKAVEFTPPSSFVLVKQFNLGNDIIKFWKV